jgi:hypothetical protein
MARSRSNAHGLRMRVLALCLACTLAACAADEDDGLTAVTTAPLPTTTVGAVATAPSTSTSVAAATTTSTTTTTTTTAASAAALVATPLQYRDDVVADRMQLQLSNGLAEPLAVAALQFVWAGFSSPVTEHTLTISPGQRVDLPVPLSPAVCTIDGTTVAPPPSLADAHVVLTLQNGSTRTAAVADDRGVLDGIHGSACEAQMIRQQAPIEFADLRETIIDDRPITVGVLRVQRGAATGPITVLSAGGTIPFTLEFPAAPAGGPLAELPASSTVIEIEVRFAEGRCDAHAVAETKQPFRFVFQLDLGDGVIRPLVVQPDPALHAQLLATVAAGCTALGLDGTLQPDG